MAVWILSEAEQLEVAALYRTNYLTQGQLAKHFGYSVPTIAKVLRLKGVTKVRTPITIPQARLLEYCQKHNITLLEVYRWNEGATHAA